MAGDEQRAAARHGLHRDLPQASLLRVYVLRLVTRPDSAVIGRRTTVGQDGDLTTDRGDAVRLHVRPDDADAVGAWATTVPHGSMTIDRPNAGEPGGPPICDGARTQAPFSIARARSSTSQWSRPVRSVKLAGTVRTSAPASASDRYSSGKRRS